MTSETDRIHAYDIGTILRLTVTDDGAAVDLTTATEVLIYIRKPDGTTLEKTATITTPPGVDGKIQYTTVEDDLDQIGTWQIQARVTFSSGMWHSEISSFEVYDNLVEYDEEP